MVKGDPTMTSSVALTKRTVVRMALRKGMSPGHKALLLLLYPVDQWCEYPKDTPFLFIYIKEKGDWIIGCPKAVGSLNSPLRL